MSDKEDAVMEEVCENVFEPVPPSPEAQDQMIVSVEGPGQDSPQTCTSDADANRTGVYSWKLPNFGIQAEKMYSERFEIGTYLWRLLVFPRGNKANCLSVYLDAPEAPYTPLTMSPKASFKLVVVNHLDPAKNFSKETSHTFTQTEADWGFTSFLPLDDVVDHSRGFVAQDGSITMEAHITVQKDERYSYDSRKETGFVGLKNQGATCYMNSLLQYLYNLPYFRKAVYHMPTEEADDPSKSIPLALQSLFYKQQYSKTSVSTKDLTKSFGWGTYDAFMQHDVQELNRVLCEKLEDKMKGTSVERVINELFEGHTCNYLECVNVDYKSSRKESFMDLQLDVKGCRNIYDSFDKYCETEMLEGQNQYKAEGHGMQDARKGVLFESLPPVLQMQLKRFEYDFHRDMMVKINDRYEFPDEIDLDREEHRYFTTTADKSVLNRFKLHSVLVHSGGVHGGHYYAFIRPDGKTWLKFDDDRVTVEDGRKAMDEQFGGEDENPLPQNVPNNFSGGGFNTASNQPASAPAVKFTKFSNAYMLVYIRISDWDRIMCPVTKDDIALHLRQRLEHEQLEKERRQKSKQEAHLYCTIKIATDQDCKEQIGRSRQFDLLDHDLLPESNVLRLKKQTRFSVVKEMVAERLGVPVHLQRFWTWTKRQHEGSMRLHRPLTPEEERRWILLDLRDFREQTLPAKKDALMDVKLYLETLPTPGNPLHPLSPQEVMLFIKVYDPFKEEIKFLMRVYLLKTMKIQELKMGVAKRERLDGDPAPRMLVFEEIRSEPTAVCEHVPDKGTLGSSNLIDGDILIVQVLPEGDHRCRFPTVDKYLEYIRNRRIVNLRKLDDPKEPGTSLEMGKEMDYDEVTERIAQHISLDDPSRLRLTQHNVYSHQPQRAPIKWHGIAKLETMLQHANHINDILYYEVLDIPLQELETLKTLKVAFHGDRTELVSEHSIRLPKDSCVRDVLEELRKALGGEQYAGKALRLMEVYQSRIYKVFDMDSGVDSINDTYWNLRAEVIPEDQLNVLANDVVIHVYHFHPDHSSPEGTAAGGADGAALVGPQQQQQQPGAGAAPGGGTPHQQQLVTNFGDPFFLHVRGGETLREVKSRIQAKLGVADEEFAKWRVAWVSVRYPPQFLEDNDIVAQHVKLASTQSSEPSYLGLQHEDRAPKRAQQAYRYTYERPVKIYN